MTIKKLLFFLFSICTLSSCIKPYIAKTDKYDTLLVVDGIVTDMPGPYTIKLSKTTKIIQFSPLQPYTNCRVELSDNVGTSEVLKEVSDGVYQTDSLNGMQGIIDRQYKLSITTPNGEVYESVAQRLSKGVGIKSVYAELETKSNPGREGYQFYIDTDLPSAANNYYLWQMESTYKFTVDFSILYYYSGGNTLHPMINKDSLKTCYRTNQIGGIYVLNTALQNTPQTIRFPLNYEDNSSKALTIRYSLNVSQYTIDEAAYNYWIQIKKIMETQGEIFSKQPYQVKNNFVNKTHPEIPALGYFTVAGMAEKRIFVDPPLMSFTIDTCKMPTGPFRPLLMSLKYYTGPADWPYFCVDASGASFFVDKECYDCRQTGVLKKPSYWID